MITFSGHPTMNTPYFRYEFPPSQKQLYVEGCRTNTNPSSVQVVHSVCTFNQIWTQGGLVEQMLIPCPDGFGVLNYQTNPYNGHLFLTGYDNNNNNNNNETMHHRNTHHITQPQTQPQTLQEDFIVFEPGQVHCLD